MPERMEPNRKRALFALGNIYATPGALQALAEAEQIPEEFIIRHVTGDWGSLPKEDIAENERALKYGNRIFSAYTLADGTRLWLITEWDRSATTLLLPAEY